MYIVCEWSFMILGNLSILKVYGINISVEGLVLKALGEHFPTSAVNWGLGVWGVGAETFRGPLSV